MSTAERIEPIIEDEAEFREELLEQQDTDLKPDLDDSAPNSVDPMRDYLRKIGKVALLNAEQEVALAKRIEAGMLAQAVLEVRNPETREAKLETMRFHMEKKKKPEVEITKNINWLKAMAMDEMVEDAALQELVKDKDEAKEQLTTANLRLVVSIAKQGRYQDRGLSLMDLIGEGNLGLMHAVEKFDHTQGFKFSTYATWWIRQAITRGLADKGQTVRIPVHLYEVLSKVRSTAWRLQQDLGRESTPEELAKELDMPVEEIRDLQARDRRPLSLDLVVGEKQKETIADVLEDADAPDMVDVLNYDSMSDAVHDALASLTAREATIIRLRFGLEDGVEHTLQEIGDQFGVTRSAISQSSVKGMKKLRDPSLAEELRPYAE